MNRTIDPIKVVLFDEDALKRMRFNDMLGRMDQMRATGRYCNIHIEQSQIVAEMIA